MRLGNDTSREIFADNFARNRGKNFVQPNSKKWLCHFFDSLRGRSRKAPPSVCLFSYSSGLASSSTGDSSPSASAACSATISASTASSTSSASMTSPSALASAFS